MFRDQTRYPIYIFWPIALLFLSPSLLAADFTPAQNLDPTSASIRLDSNYRDDAWLVYTYDIDVNGLVANALVRSSNGVTAVENAVLGKLSMMRFKPATRDGKPVQVAADPVTFTWILDLPREMSPPFKESYQAAWTHFSQGDYSAASGQATKLKDMPGRNAFEEVKYQVLAASLATRRMDEAAELRHLKRAVALQNLALDNKFKNRYIEPDQYLLILERIQALQLQRSMLADAADTLDQIREQGGDTEVATRASAAYREAEARINTQADVAINGELEPIYPDGPGAWKAGLSRKKFSLSDVTGKIYVVFLVCGPREIQLSYPSEEPWTIPYGMDDCKIDVAGSSGARFVLHQYLP